jgi:DNA-binding GntR family transcriptional regulator
MSCSVTEPARRIAAMPSRWASRKAPVFFLRQRTYSRDVCAEIAFSTYRADRYRIHLGLKTRVAP